MRLVISTRVEQSLLEVKSGFTKELFLSLNPPFPPVRLLQFDGCKKGDKVALELNFIFFKQKWVSVITHDNTDENLFEFIDEGAQLPFFLKTWIHHHKVLATSDGESEIVDDITFTSPFLLMDYLLFPALYLQFLYRKPVYKKLFKPK